MFSARWLAAYAQFDARVGVHPAGVSLCPQSLNPRLRTYGIVSATPVQAAKAVPLPSMVTIVHDTLTSLKLGPKSPYNFMSDIASVQFYFELASVLLLAQYAGLMRTERSSGALNLLSRMVRAAVVASCHRLCTSW
jgi:hypothetical protein